MNSEPRILAFAGSLRSGSFNKKLARVCAEKLRSAGAEVTLIELNDYSLPLYDGDIEKNQGLPENAIKLQDLFDEHDGLLIASPEYNSSITGVLKNTIDWVSRSREGRSSLFAFKNKVAALVGTSPGSKGALRSIYSLREILQNIGVTCLPGEVAVPNAGDVFNQSGELTNERSSKLLDRLTGRLVDTLRRLKAGKPAGAAER